MNPIHSLLRRFAPVVLALLAWLLTGAPALAQDLAFCPALKRAIEAKAKGFAPLKIKPYHGSTKEWDARVNLPGTQFCRVDLERKSYNCWVTGLSSSWTSEESGKLKAQLTGCLGEPATPEKSDDLGSTRRTTLAWESEGARIELVTRIGKQTPAKHSVFVYVR